MPRFRPFAANHKLLLAAWLLVLLAGFALLQLHASTPEMQAPAPPKWPTASRLKPQRRRLHAAGFHPPVLSMQPRHPGRIGEHHDALPRPAEGVRRVDAAERRTSGLGAPRVLAAPLRRFPAFARRPTSTDAKRCGLGREPRAKHCCLIEAERCDFPGASPPRGDTPAAMPERTRSSPGFSTERQPSSRRRRSAARCRSSPLRTAPLRSQRNRP